MQDQFAPLGSIRVVLVATSHPGNIGAVARAMKNMGLSDLVLVNPSQFPSYEASARASGAADILDQANVVSSLAEALHDCHQVIGASARLRKVSWPQLSARDVGEHSVKAAQDGRVALVFGREDSGLTNEELDQCHILGHIASNPDYSSLNLAAAVQVFTYECRMACKPSMPGGLGYRFDAATHAQMEGFYAHLEQALAVIEYLDPDKHERFMRRMRRLFNRAQLDAKEVTILRGVLAAATKKAQN
ncbi:RNA methyltransferase [Thiomicrospira sp. ALE5]|uniref:RNA methyltransferase n=1 Tax=Thiomicrospira sp. ALE5 TaxID=748650 RepID=UPI0008ED262A|nr:RNA methyltransferase [Thiomicrospira sp. ALE5]SFR63134.1 tRNA (cytidine32/uridine32-2'-O)-methyltransferase [Thiomicrospira sp. ALE5]